MRLRPKDIERSDMREKITGLIVTPGLFPAERAVQILALIAEEVRAIKNLYEPVVKVVSGDTLYIDADVNRHDVVENFRQKVLELLEGK